MPQQFWLTQVQGVNSHYSAVTETPGKTVIAQREQVKTGFKSLDAHETHSFTPGPQISEQKDTRGTQNT